MELRAIDLNSNRTFNRIQINRYPLWVINIFSWLCRPIAISRISFICSRQSPGKSIRAISDGHVLFSAPRWLATDKIVSDIRFGCCIRALTSWDSDCLFHPMSSSNIPISLASIYNKLVTKCRDRLITTYFHLPFTIWGTIFLWIPFDMKAP